MKNILVAFTTNAGSTEEVAQAIAEELSKNGAHVDVKRLEDVTTLEPYQGVVIGAPMILGWHRSARRFIKKHQKSLSQRQVAYFCTAMSLTQTDPKPGAAPPIFIDPWLAKPAKNPERLSIKENYATLENYLRPIFKAAPGVKPLTIAFLGGKLELFRLKLLQMLFVMLVIQAQPGDLRNWDAIQAWAADLSKSFSTTR
jgi:menaquinone-dependent protoporphyrinogen oxidase